MTPSGAGSINEIIVNALNNFLIPLASALAVGFIIYGGVLYITSGGDSDKTAKAKKTILWAVAGIFLIVLSYLIIKMVGTVVKDNIL